MREQIYACEERFLISWLERRENASAADLQMAASLFRRSDPDDPTDGIYSEQNGVATIRIEGPLSMSGPDPIDLLYGYGGTGYRQIMAGAAQARERKPRSVILAMNTPGGEVAGVDQAWQALRAMAAEIPTVAENRGIVASAGYYLASAAPKIVATSPAAEQGSIGIIIVGIDDSKMGEKLGMRRVKIVSKVSPKKGAGVDSAEGRSVLQERTDALAAVFVERVATGRNTTVEDVVAHFGEGALLIAKAALGAGMIDDIVAAVPPAGSQLTAVAAQAGTSVPQPLSGSGALPVQFPIVDISRNLAATMPPQTPQDRRSPMTLSELLQANPGAGAELETRLKAEYDRGRKDVEARVASAKPFLALTPTQDGYSAAQAAQIAKLAVDVIAGAEEPAVLRSFVRMIDMSIEGRKLEAAIEETAAQGETPPQQQRIGDPAAVIGADGDVAKAEADFQALIARERGTAAQK